MKRLQYYYCVAGWCMGLPYAR